MERAEIRERLDYRNARYEGRTKKGMPHGEGIVIDLNYLFCLASWREGQIDGPCFVVFPDGSIFCGRIIEKQMVGMCTLYLKDHIRIFTNSVQEQTKRKSVVHLPYLQLLLEMDKQESDKQKTIKRFNEDKSQSAIIDRISQIINSDTTINIQYDSWKTYLRNNFGMSQSGRIDIYETRLKEIFVGIKGGGVGAKIDHKQVLDGINHESNIVNVIGNFGREGVLHEFGFKSVVGSKGYIKREEFVQGDSSSFVDKYDCRDRPKSFPLEIARYLRKSFYFLNKFLDLTFLYDLQHLYKDINLRVVTQTERIAQVSLETVPPIIYRMADTPQRQISLGDPYKGSIIESRQNGSTTRKNKLNPQFYLEAKESIERSFSRKKAIEASRLQNNKPEEVQLSPNQRNQQYAPKKSPQIRNNKSPLTTKPYSHINCESSANRSAQQISLPMSSNSRSKYQSRYKYLDYVDNSSRMQATSRTKRSGQDHPQNTTLPMKGENSIESYQTKFHELTKINKNYQYIYLRDVKDKSKRKDARIDSILQDRTDELSTWQHEISASTFKSRLSRQRVQDPHFDSLEKIDLSSLDKIDSNAEGEIESNAQYKIGAKLSGKLKRRDGPKTTQPQPVIKLIKAQTRTSHKIEDSTNKNERVSPYSIQTRTTNMVQDNFTHEPQPNRSEKSPGRIVVRDKKKPIFSANEFES